MKNKVHSSVGYITFLFLPILSFFIAIKNYRQMWSKNVVWAFTAFYGYHFASPNEGADINRYIEKFHEYTNDNYTIGNFIVSMYSAGSTTLDVLEPLTSYLLGRITTNHHLLLLIYGIIFGYFFSRNLWIIIDHTKGSLTLRSVAALTLLVVEIGIWEINGFRFWCAAHMFIYATLNLVLLNNRKGYIFLVLSCLMHLGMFVPVVALLIYRFIKLPVSMLFVFFIFTFFIAELNIEFVRNLLNTYAPSFLSNKLSSYTSNEYIELVNETLGGYSIFYQLSTKIRLVIIVLFTGVIFYNKKLFMHTPMFQLFAFYLLLGSLANILSQLPSGSRYVIISDFILYGITFYFFQSYKQFALSKYINVVIPFLFVYAFYNFRIIGIHTFSIHHFINNPLVSLFIY